MRKSILASALLVGALTTSVFAFPGNGGFNCPQIGANMPQGMMAGAQMEPNNMQGPNGYMMAGNQMGYGMNQMGPRMQRGGSMMFMFAGLQLTNEQQYKMSILRDEMRLDMRKAMGMSRWERPMFKFITKNGFDEKGYKNYMIQRSQKMIDLRTEYMKKMFDILTKEQIAKLQPQK